MRARRLPCVLFSLVIPFAFVAIPGVAKADSPIVSGAGSTWSQVAIDQWRADVSRFGLRINYQGVGSSAGRSFYIQNQVDFAASEIPFQPNETSTLASQHRTFAYTPDVAGGTSFMYNLKDTSNNPITTLRLSSTTVTEIFTGVITNWNDARLKTDNPGLNLPNEAIIPVVRSDGSGTSAQFTLYMSKMEPTLWCNFAKSQGIGCGFTSTYPAFNGAASASGSDGVANYVQQEPQGDGAITYVETAYALQRGRPVAFLKNASGNYTLPTSQNVSTALTKATLNSDHTQNLDAVYTNPDPNTYALSSYSYMIVPSNNFDAAKGNVLGQFMLYFACEGQRKADLLGYSPLPPNLVQVVFSAEQQVPGAPQPPPLSQCDNPTIQGGTGSVSNGTAAALSGGHSTSGATTAAAPQQSGGVALAAGARAGTVGGSNTSGGAGGVNELGAAGGPTAGGPAGTTAYASTTQALPQISLSSSLPSGAPLAAAGLLVSLLVFAPPLVASANRRRRG